MFTAHPENATRDSCHLAKMFEAPQAAWYDIYGQQGHSKPGGQLRSKKILQEMPMNVSRIVFWKSACRRSYWHMLWSFCAVCPRSFEVIGVFLPAASIRKMFPQPVRFCGFLNRDAATS